MSLDKKYFDNKPAGSDKSTVFIDSGPDDNLMVIRGVALMGCIPDIPVTKQSMSALEEPILVDIPLYGTATVPITLYNDPGSVKVDTEWLISRTDDRITVDVTCTPDRYQGSYILYSLHPALTTEITESCKKRSDK